MRHFPAWLLVGKMREGTTEGTPGLGRLMCPLKRSPGSSQASLDQFGKNYSPASIWGQGVAAGVGACDVLASETQSQP